MTLAADEEGKMLTCARTPIELAPLVWMEPPDTVTLASPVALPPIDAESPTAPKPFDVLATCPPAIVIFTLPLPNVLVASTVVSALELIEPPPIVMFPGPLRGLLIVIAPRPTPVIEVTLLTLIASSLALTAAP
ncbi:hypothetical protein [Variovorax paradoxus]|uniref:hypothetical protein n=1 Tax=Variovorax paradoxus TaxID=34073 RepID=UPI0027D7C2DD|nr:hypothetical protein [Variovorax paradoxus]